MTFLWCEFGFGKRFGTSFVQPLSQSSLVTLYNPLFVTCRSLIEIWFVVALNKRWHFKWQFFKIWNQLMRHPLTELPHLSAAAAESLQSCPTLCNPIDGSLPGSPIPGILQARTLEWVAISFFNAWKWKVKVKSLSRVRLLATPWTAAYQAPPSMRFSRQEYWSGLPLSSPSAKDTLVKNPLLPNSQPFLPEWSKGGGIAFIFILDILFRHLTLV